MTLDVCTCGARLYEDSRFCHRCGRALRESDAALNEVAVAAPPPLPRDIAAEFPVDADAIGFRNPAALQALKMVAPAIIVLSTLGIFELLSAFACSWLAGAIYRKKTGRILSTGGGAKLGWMVGSANAVVSLVVVAIKFALFREELIKMMVQMSPQSAKVFDTPAGLALVILGTAIFLVIFQITAGIAGGALGAKMSPGTTKPAR